MTVTTYTPAASDGDAASFNIDAVTGQITVSASAMLDADGTNATNPYIVVVRAVDGDGDDENITVNIYVRPKGEPPTIDRVYETTARVAAPHLVGDRVPTEMTHYEMDRLNALAIEIDTDLDTEAIYPPTYWATDPEDLPATIGWSLEGPDATRLVNGVSVPVFGFVTDDTDPITVPTTTTGPMATLAFVAGPNFEEPWDEDEDNVYEVTIVATDPTGNSDELDVTVKVINSTEDNEPGTVTFTNRQPEVASPLTAVLSDDDTPIERTIEMAVVQDGQSTTLGF